MREPLEFLIYGDSNEGSRNKRLHWQAERRIKERWRDRALFTIHQKFTGEAGIWYADRVRITFTIYRGRLLDPDNAAGSFVLKVIVDCLKGRFFPDDSSRYVSYGPIRQVTGKQYAKQPAVGVLIEDCAGPAGLEPEKAPLAPGTAQAHDSRGSEE